VKPTQNSAEKRKQWKQPSPQEVLDESRQTHEDFFEQRIGKGNKSKKQKE
jgi:hypothetical protein